eukprot:2782463-Amphidinium_carterae.1
MAVSTPRSGTTTCFASYWLSMFVCYLWHRNIRDQTLCATGHVMATNATHLVSDLSWLRRLQQPAILRIPPPDHHVHVMIPDLTDESPNTGFRLPARTSNSQMIWGELSLALSLRLCSAERLGAVKWLLAHMTSALRICGSFLWQHLLVMAMLPGCKVPGLQ